MGHLGGPCTRQAAHHAETDGNILPSNMCRTRSDEQDKAYAAAVEAADVPPAVLAHRNPSPDALASCVIVLRDNIAQQLFLSLQDARRAMQTNMLPAN